MTAKRIQELVSQIVALKMEQHQLRTKVQFVEQARQRQERRENFLDATSLMLEKSVAVVNRYNLDSDTLFLCVKLGRRSQRYQHDWRHLINAFVSSNTFPDTTSRCFMFRRMNIISRFEAEYQSALEVQHQNEELGIVPTRLKIYNHFQRRFQIPGRQFAVSFRGARKFVMKFRREWRFGFHKFNLRDDTTSEERVLLGRLSAG
jgi:hypothetical protein